MEDTHCSTVICLRHFLYIDGGGCHVHHGHDILYIDGGGCHVHHGHDICYGNGVHVSDGECSNGGCVILVLPPPHGGDEYASPSVEHGW